MARLVVERGNEKGLSLSLDLGLRLRMGLGRRLRRGSGRRFRGAAGDEQGKNECNSKRSHQESPFAHNSVPVARQVNQSRVDGLADGRMNR